MPRLPIGLRKKPMGFHPSDLLSYPQDPMTQSKVPGTRTSFVYWILAPSVNLVKIGITEMHLNNRLRDLTSGSPIPLVPLGYMFGNRIVEDAYHFAFRRLHSHYEWFHYRDELKEYAERFPFPWPRAGEQTVRPGRDDRNFTSGEVATGIIGWAKKAKHRYRRYGGMRGSYDSSCL